MDTNTTPAHTEESQTYIGEVVGAPRQVLRLEGAVLATAATLGYAATSSPWWMFAVLFLVPDVFMLGYLMNKRLGAILYNLGHSTTLPAVALSVGIYGQVPLVISLSLIWLAHVGFDRAVGYGLKYGSSFQKTHLGTPFRPRK